MKKNSWENTRKKERKFCVITSMVTKRKNETRGQQKKKEKLDSFDDNEKEQLKKYEKKGKKVKRDSLGMMIKNKFEQRWKKKYF